MLNGLHASLPQLTLALLLLVVVAISLASATAEPSAMLANQDEELDRDQLQELDQDADLKKDQDELNSCQYNYLRLPASYVQLSVYQLQFNIQQYQKPSGPQLLLVGRPNATNHHRDNEQVELKQHQRVVPTFKRLDLEASSAELRIAGLEPGKPFKIFMSGFNPNPYLKTIANFWTIALKVETAIQRLMVFVENEHRPKMRELILAANTGSANFSSKAGKHGGGREHLLSVSESFSFYGHSLGSHLLARAVRNIHAKQKDIKFGKLIGLDPAEPCFSDETLGISESRLHDSISDLMIIHSNAGFAGLYSARGQVEVVLNGGTFQPNCSWYDLRCHHSRSTDIFSYSDDTCQMVAYECYNYEQFKLGACQLCLGDQDDDGDDDEFRYLDHGRVTTNQGNGTRSQRRANCLLVNLPEQHIDREPLVLRDDVIKYKRHLDFDNNNDDDPNGTGRNETKITAAVPSTNDAANGTKLDENQPPKTQNNYLARASTNSSSTPYYYVNTHSNFKQTSSHCLQHYQVRLLLLTKQSNSSMQTKNCPASRFITGDAIDLQLFYSREPNTQATIARPLEQQVQLRPLVGNLLYTGLLTFPNQARIFTGASLTNVDIEAWSECLRNYGRHDANSTDYRLLLDVAFMSHIEAKRRYAHSSLLCGHFGQSALDSGDILDLKLCKLSKLIEARRDIDATLRSIQFNNQFNDWQTTMLNGLFQLFTGWQPFRGHNQ